MSVFLFCKITLIGLLQVVILQMHLMVPLEQTALQIARESYLAHEISDSPLLSYGLVTARAGSVMKNKVNSAFLEKAGVTGGLSFMQTTVLENGSVELVVSYKVKLPFQVLPLPPLPVRQCCKVHPWIGFLYPEGRQEQMVFVTPTGTVYHKSVTCTYLKLSIQPTTKSALKDLRNASGGKYYPCERCENYGKTVYITQYGDRYHSTLACSGLKRGIRKIPISQVGNKKPCSKCG